jgi:cob(I)alamin adenosyltransferase
MTIYTKKGDDGSTYLFNGKRVMKNHLIIKVLGSIDKLSSLIGYASSQIKNKSEKSILLNIQKDLYLIMSHISGAKTDLKVVLEKIKRFEQFIDKLSSWLPNLNRFIIPSGPKTTGLFHILRTETRSCERIIVSCFIKLKKLKKEDEKIILKYINRLSDLFFILARKYSKDKEVIVEFLG